MKQTFLSLVLITLSSFAMANDGVFYLAGNQLVPMQETDISVKKEILTINIGDDGMADVDVYYEFFNSGAEKTLLVGFEANAPYNGDYAFNRNGIHPYIHKFSVEMNNTPLRYSNGVYPSDIGAGTKPLDLKEWSDDIDEFSYGNLFNAKLDSFCNFSYVYKFNATFHPGKNIVRHTYRYEMSYSIGALFILEYKLTPATRWANHKIDDFTLRITAKNTAKQFTIAAYPFKKHPFKFVKGMGKIRYIGKKDEYDNELYEVSLRNGEMEWHCTDFAPAEELIITSAEHVYMSEPFVPGAFYDRNARPDIYMDMSINDPDQNPRILRNLPYANRGYVFKSQDLRDYFSNIWWYMPDPSWKASTADFTKMEQELIRKK